MTKPGDWVRFYSGGRLVIGVVQYVEPCPISSARIFLHTDQGTITESEVRECRPVPEEPRS